VLNSGSGVSELFSLSSDWIYQCLPDLFATPAVPVTAVDFLGQQLSGFPFRELNSEGYQESPTMKRKVYYAIADDREKAPAGSTSQARPP